MNKCKVDGIVSCTDDNQCGDDEFCRSDHRCAGKAFITKWDIKADELTIKLPLSVSSSEFTIDWGDGTTTKATSREELNHTYASANQYIISVTGDFNYENGDGLLGCSEATQNCKQLVDIISFGDIAIYSWGALAYSGLVTISAKDIPNPNKLTSLEGLFLNSQSFNGDISKWDVSNVKNMLGMFYDASLFNGDISKWDVSNVKDMSGMFLGASLFNSDISKWNVSNVKRMTLMFSKASSFNQDISKWDVSNVYSFHNMFTDASSFNQNLIDWNLSSYGYYLSPDEPFYHYLHSYYPSDYLKKLNI